MAPFEVGENPGPAVPGHDPLVAGEARKQALDAIEGTGAVSFRDDPALPWLKTDGEMMDGERMPDY
jgi:hypothetical protein